MGLWRAAHLRDRDLRVRDLCVHSVWWRRLRLGLAQLCFKTVQHRLVGRRMAFEWDNDVLNTLFQGTKEQTNEGPKERRNEGN